MRSYCNKRPLPPHCGRIMRGVVRATLPPTRRQKRGQHPPGAAFAGRGGKFHSTKRRSVPRLYCSRTRRSLSETPRSFWSRCRRPVCARHRVARLSSGRRLTGRVRQGQEFTSAPTKRGRGVIQQATQSKWTNCRLQMPWRYQ